MASCVICSSLASVFCTQDRAFLCSGCDLSIHSANVISRTHKRLPVCELCKRSAASVYCKEDQACLCPGCDTEVHLANPLPHTTVPIDQALAQNLCCSAAIPLAPPPPARPSAPEVPRIAAEDETSGCGDHCAANNTGGCQRPASSSSDMGLSLAVVPEMAGLHDMTQALPSTSAGSKDLKGLWGKDFDALDFEAAWMGNLDVGLDFSDILGNDGDDAPGMVPSIPAEEQAALQRAKSLNGGVVLDLGDSPSAGDMLEPLGDDDFVVPSFLPEDFGDELEAVNLPAVEQKGTKRPASYDAQTKASRRSKPSTLPALHLAPPPPPLSKSSSDSLYYPTEQQPQTTTRRETPKTQPVMNGANLTREQRVARYREKRKNRKFQKTIRYASRKAYAEVRPRIKGRFATREEVAAWKARKAAGIFNEEDELMIF